MKTLRLLLMQTMFWLNIANDVFNIKMRNSYLSFMRLCASVRVFLGVLFCYFCLCCRRRYCYTSSTVYIVRMTNKFERRYKNHNNHANCCYYNRLWAKCFACVFFALPRTHREREKENKKLTEYAIHTQREIYMYTQYKNHKNHKTNNKTHP